MVKVLYNSFHEDFPHTHCVFSKIVSSSAHYIEIANMFDGDVEENSDTDTEPEEESNVDDDDTANQHSLHMHERAILKYLLDMIRLKSQKKTCVSGPCWPHFGFIVEDSNTPSGKFI